MWDNPFVEFEMDVIKMNRLLTNYLRNGYYWYLRMFYLQRYTGYNKTPCFVFTCHPLKISKLDKICLHLKKIVAVYNVFTVFLNTKRSLQSCSSNVVKLSAELM